MAWVAGPFPHTFRIYVQMCVYGQCVDTRPTKLTNLLLQPVRPIPHPDVISHLYGTTYIKIQDAYTI